MFTLASEWVRGTPTRGLPTGRSRSARPGEHLGASRYRPSRLGDRADPVRVGRQGVACEQYGSSRIHLP